MLSIILVSLQQEKAVTGNTTVELTDADNTLTFQTEKTHVIISPSSDQAIAPLDSPKAVS